MISRFPPKGWCWHRDAKLIDPKASVWACPHCQNVAQLVQEEKK